MAKGIKGFVLAAGLGTRLRPLTSFMPKPLFPFIGPTLLDLAIFQLYRSGIRSIAVNTHYLPQKIQDHLKCRWERHDIHISYEPILLGTGGCLNPLREWCGRDDVLIYNADIVSDIDIKALIAGHRTHNPLGTLVLLPELLPDKNPVHCLGEEIIGIGRDFQPSGSHDGARGLAQMHTFTGVHLLSRRFLDRAPHQEPWHIIDFYNQLLEDGEKLRAHFHKSFWHDLGNPSDYLTAITAYLENHNKDLDRRLGVSEVGKAVKADFQLVEKGQQRENIFGPSVIGANLNIPISTVVGPGTMIVNGVHIPENLEIKNSLILPEAKLLPGEKLQNQIICSDQRVKIAQ